MNATAEIRKSAKHARAKISRTAYAAREDATEVARIRSKVASAIEGFVGDMAAARAHTANQRAKSGADAADEFVLRSPWTQSVLRLHWARYRESRRAGERQ